MKPRIEYHKNARAIQAMPGLEHHVQESGLQFLLLCELVTMRASQINGWNRLAKFKEDRVLHLRLCDLHRGSPDAG